MASRLATLWRPETLCGLAVAAAALAVSGSLWSALLYGTFLVVVALVAGRLGEATAAVPSLSRAEATETETTTATGAMATGATATAPLPVVAPEPSQPSVLRHEVLVVPDPNQPLARSRSVPTIADMVRLEAEASRDELAVARARPTTPSPTPVSALVDAAPPGPLAAAFSSIDSGAPAHHLQAPPAGEPCECEALTHEPCQCAEDDARRRLESALADELGAAHDSPATTTAPASIAPATPATHAGERARKAAKPSAAAAEDPDGYPDTLYVCVKCRYSINTGVKPAPICDIEDLAMPMTSGQVLYADILQARDRRLAEAPDSALARLRIEPVDCLSTCYRSVCVALQGQHKYTYQFGDLDPRSAAGPVLEFAEQYAQSDNGFSKNKTRPLGMRDNILARVPPPPN